MSYFLPVEVTAGRKTLKNKMNPVDVTEKSETKVRFTAVEQLKVIAFGRTLPQILPSFSSCSVLF
jgi:hypothetical protein